MNIPPRQPLHVISSTDKSAEEILIPLLASRSCHLPGNSWTQDWIQWFRNNHILFGICLHHDLHPLEAWERCLLLAASVSFGLVMTNLHLIYRFELELALGDQELVGYQGYTLTAKMLVLWAVGGVSHSIFDMAIWHIMACACCHPGGRWGAQRRAKNYKDCGSYALIPLILALLGLAVFLVLLRATYEADELEGDQGYTGTIDIAIEDWRSFSFLTEYATELAVAWFLCFPLLGTIVFSGILGCGGRLPVLGGRPRDLQRVAEGRSGLFNHQQTSSAYNRF